MGRMNEMWGRRECGRREGVGGVGVKGRLVMAGLPLAARWKRVSEHSDRTFMAKLRSMMTPFSGKPRPSIELTHSLPNTDTRRRSDFLNSTAIKSVLTTDPWAVGAGARLHWFNPAGCQSSN